MRCESKHPEKGTQCGLPAHHNGAHANGTICHPWYDKPKPVSEHEVKIEHKPYSSIKIPFSGQ
jgi:hypothetical protein